ncbi:transposase [Streptomyces sp. NBC_01264]|uniref:transposase n=1 Tax=Streptomyces sp. NBC_01264 TaxID=2903804 RepID=UPI002B1D73E2|nr:transposase [Streptomyces sp. NBC_01264]
MNAIRQPRWCNSSPTSVATGVGLSCRIRPSGRDMSRSQRLAARQRDQGELCDHGVGAVLDSPVHRAEPAAVREAGDGYPGTGLVIPHRRERGQTELPDWKEEHNKSRKQVRARVERVFARMKTWKILRDCRLKGDGVHHAMLGIARLPNLALAG